LYVALVEVAANGVGLAEDLDFYGAHCEVDYHIRVAPNIVGLCVGEKAPATVRGRYKSKMALGGAEAGAQLLFQSGDDALGEGG